MRLPVPDHWRKTIPLCWKNGRPLRPHRTHDRILGVIKRKIFQIANNLPYLKKGKRLIFNIPNVASHLRMGQV